MSQYHTNSVSVYSLILQDLLKGKGKGFSVHRLKLFGKSALKKIFGFKKEEVTGGWKNLHIGKGKSKVVLMLNQAPRHENISRCEDIALCFLNRFTGWR
jgi:hypothetical protein